MDSEQSVEGVVVVLEGNAVKGLRHLAKTRSFSILEVEAADMALKHVRSVDPRVIIVQVGPNGREAIKFIRKAKAAAWRAPLIAAAARHTARLEQEVRRAGVSVYVPGASPGLLDPLLEAVLATEEQK